jgi:hypothetical protein
MGKIDNAPIWAIFTYVFGTMMNFFLVCLCVKSVYILFQLIIYWHWYWWVESCYNSARKVKNNRVIESHNRRSVSVRHPLNATEQKTLDIRNGFIETTRTPIANGHKPNGAIQHMANGVPKHNGILANGHARLTTIEVPKKFPVQSSHLATLLDKNDAQATMRRQSVLVDELSAIESSGSSLTSSNSHYQRRRLPTIGTNYPRHSPFIQSQCSSLSLPISQPAVLNRHTPTIKKVEFDRDQTPIPNYSPRNDHYEKNKVGHRASLQQNQQIIEPHLRQMRRYQSNIVGMSMLPRIAYSQMPPPPAPSTSIVVPLSPRSRRLYSAGI